MVQKISFTKSRETDTVQKLNVARRKTGLKEIDEWLANPSVNHKYCWIFRVKIEPFELSLNGKEGKVKVTEFFVRNNTLLVFFLDNALKENNDFELQWIEEYTGNYIGFSENHSNVLVVDSNFLSAGRSEEEHKKIRQDWDFRDLKVDWKNINLLECGLSFDLNYPLIVSLNDHNFFYDKIFLSLDFPQDYFEPIKKKLTEWKENKKPIVIKNAALSTKSWLSVKNSKFLYVVDTDPEELEIGELVKELVDERFFGRKISGWEKLPYQERRKFLDRWPQEDVESMKNEIEDIIQVLENNDNQNEKVNNKSTKPFSPAPLSKPYWKNPLIIVIIGAIVLLFSSFFEKNRIKTKKE